MMKSILKNHINPRTAINATSFNLRLTLSAARFFFFRIYSRRSRPKKNPIRFPLPALMRSVGKRDWNFCLYPGKDKWPRDKMGGQNNPQNIQTAAHGRITIPAIKNINTPGYGSAGSLVAFMTASLIVSVDLDEFNYCTRAPGDR
jgi:hypothetical protein